MRRLSYLFMALAFYVWPRPCSPRAGKRRRQLGGHRSRFFDGDRFRHVRWARRRAPRPPQKPGTKSRGVPVFSWR